jgi:hypothetical protein
VAWGAVVGVVTAASPLAFWWLDPSTVYAFGLVLIAAIYIGFAVADGRPKVIVAESTVASVFVVVAAVAVTGSVWLIVVGLVGHGLKDLWQHRRQFVANTRWWPPFCVIVDWYAEFRQSFRQSLLGAGPLLLLAREGAARQRSILHHYFRRAR